MGKSVTPYSQVIEQLQTSFRDFRRCLTRADQARFDRLFDAARQHTPGGVLLGDPDPFRPVLLGMLIELSHRIEQVQEVADANAGAQRGDSL